MYLSLRRHSVMPVRQTLLGTSGECIPSSARSSRRQYRGRRKSGGYSSGSHVRIGATLQWGLANTWIPAERSQEKTPVRYTLTTEQMIENEYPVPSYMAQTFEKPAGWVETPQPSDTSLAHKVPRVFAIDCEMVYIFFSPLRNPLIKL